MEELSLTVFVSVAPDERDLFEAELEPIIVEEQGLRDLGVGKQEIIEFKGKKNKVAVGRPQCIDIINEFQKHNENLSERIKKLTNQYDFRLIILSCSFRPEEGCKFENATFVISLNAKTKEGQTHDIGPIAYDTFPEKLLAETKVKREISFTPEAKVSVAPVEVGVTSTVSRSTEFIVYTPEMFSYGVGTSDVSWDFRETKQNELIGDKKNLLIVVQTPKDSNVIGRFILGAKISSGFTRWIPIPVSVKKDRIIDEEHIICQ